MSRRLRALRRPTRGLAATSAPDPYRIASNRFALPTDWGTTDSGFAAGGGSTGINGGDGVFAQRYFFRRWKFATAWAPRQPRFLWANAQSSVNGVLPGLFSFTIQKAQIRRTDETLVDTLKWSGSGSYVMAPGGKVWNDAGVDLAADTTYYLDIWWTAPDSAAFPIGPFQCLLGERSTAHASTDLSLSGPAGVAGDVLSRAGFWPCMMVGRGGTAYPSAMLFGDSILDYGNVSAKLAPDRGDLGHVQQALGDTTGGRIAYSSTARYGSAFSTLYTDNIGGFGGQNICDWIADANALLQAKPIFNVAISEHCHNTMGGTGTFAATKTIALAARSKLLSRYPGMPWLQTTTTPATTVATNEAFVPGTTQTPTGAATTAGGALQSWNDWVLAGGDGFIALGIDTAVVCRDVADYGLWKTYAFSTTLLDAVAANTTNVIRTAAAPAVGDVLVIDAGNASIDYGSLATVYSVAAAGGGGFTVTLTSGARNSFAEATAFQSNLTKAHSIGAVVQKIPTSDGTHPAHTVQMLMRDQMIAVKAAITTAAGATAYAAVVAANSVIDGSGSTVIDGSGNTVVP